MKSIFISLLGLIWASASMAASPILDSDFEKYLVDNMKKFGTVGVAVGVVKEGKLVYAKGFGYRDLDKKLPVTQTLFGIGSTTNAFTARAIGLLVERGLISYDVPVVSVLPDFEQSNPITTQTATLRDLLGHTTGVPRHDMAWFSNFRNREEVFQNLFAFPYHNNLRTVWEYNNIMYLVAGIVVDRFSGMTWESFVRENILSPLKMTATNFSTDDSKKSDDFSYAQGFFTSVGFVPESKTGVIVFVNTPNSLNPDRIMESAFDRILGLPARDRLNIPQPKLNLPEKVRKFEPLPLSVTEYLGTYDNFGYDDVVVELALKNEKGQQIILKYKVLEFPLRHGSNNVFEMSKYEDVVFDLGVDGKPRSLFIPFEPAIRNFAPKFYRRK